MTRKDICELCLKHSIEKQKEDGWPSSILFGSAAFWWLTRGNCYRTGGPPEEHCEYYLEHLMNEQK